MMRRFVIGDIHGRHEALLQCLDRSGFDRERDLLIVLGDVADGGEAVAACFDELLTIKHLEYVLGNHDEWFLEWAKGEYADHLNMLWWNQGGLWTARSYGFSTFKVPAAHKRLLDDAHWYFELDGMVFVHGVFDPHKLLKEHEKHFLLWDRSIIDRAINGAKFPRYSKVFIGHTTVQLIQHDESFTEPLVIGKLHCLDTGAGWSGRLTIMDVDSGVFWQSDLQRPGR
jgi:serine/threonine protein phosphatase 1